MNFAPSSMQYIVPIHGGRFRVRFPRMLLQKRWYGTYATLEQAIAARDHYLEGRSIVSPVNESDIDFASITIPHNARRQFARPLTIPTTNVLVMGDLHIPHHNQTMLKRAVYITRRYFPHIDHVCLIGDTWDWTSLSKHPKDQPSEDIDECLDMGGAMLRHLSDYFQDIWMTNGNHDARIGLKLDAPFTLKRVVNAALGDEWTKGRIHVTNLDYVYADGQDTARNWILGHPSHYGQSGKVPAVIADLEQRNVATGHNHQIGIQQSPSGRWMGVDVGHMTDPDSHYYVVRRLTKYVRWNSGFLVLSHGHPHPYWERWTDWARLGC